MSRTVSVVSPGNVTFWKWRCPEMIKSMPYLAHPDLQLEFSWLATAKWAYHTHYNIEKKVKLMYHNEYRIYFVCHNILCAVNTYIYIHIYVYLLFYMLYTTYVSLYWYFWWTLCHKSTYLCFLKTTTHLTFCWTITKCLKSIETKALPTLCRRLSKSLPCWHVEWLQRSLNPSKVPKEGWCLSSLNLVFLCFALVILVTAACQNESKLHCTLAESERPLSANP